MKLQRSSKLNLISLVSFEKVEIWIIKSPFYKNSKSRQVHNGRTRDVTIKYLVNVLFLSQRFIYNYNECISWQTAVFYAHIFFWSSKNCSKNNTEYASWQYKLYSMSTKNGIFHGFLRSSGLILKLMNTFDMILSSDIYTDHRKCMVY